MFTVDVKQQHNYNNSSPSNIRMVVIQSRKLVGCIGFYGPLRQYFSLYQAVSKREGERGEKR